MNKTPFAGLTVLAPGESIQTDNASFVRENPAITDHFLEIGAVTHRHDAHAALADPVLAPSGTVFSTGGSIGPDISISLGYTLLDADGGETTLSPVDVISTDAPYEDPTSALEAVVSYASGSLGVNTFYYAITLTDGLGGETATGPVLSVDREPGSDVASITLFGLTDDFPVNDAVAWRLYRAVGGGALGYLASGTVDSFTDSGGTCVDCGQAPPNVNRTNRAQSFHAQVPSSGFSSGAVAFNLYGSLDGSFGGDCRLGTFPLASGDTQLVFTALSFLDGNPPDVSTSVRGASRINADDLAGLTWNQPVASSGELPSTSGVRGVARIALAESLAYAALGASGGLAGGAGWFPLPASIGVSDGDNDIPFSSELVFVGASGARVDVSASGAATMVRVAGGLGPRFWASGVAAGLTAGASGIAAVPLATGYRLLEVSVSQPSRVRVYPSAAERTADRDRPFAVPADPNASGPYLDIVASGAPFARKLTPLVDGYNMEDTPSNLVPIIVENLTVGTHDVVVAFLFVPTE